jgi:hypothetical protein
MINEDKLQEYRGEIQLTVSTKPAAKCANGSTVVIGCLTISTQSKEIWHVVLFYCSAALGMDEHLLERFVPQNSCEMKTYVYSRAAVWFKFNSFTSSFLGGRDIYIFYVVAYHISFHVLCKSQHNFRCHIAFQHGHTNPYINSSPSITVFLHTCIKVRILAYSYKSTYPCILV